MKKLKTLSLTDVNNIEFRNLNEVNRWLKQLDREIDDTGKKLNILKHITSSCMDLPVLGAKTYVVAPPVKKRRRSKIDPKTKVVVPKLRELTKNFDLLEDLYRQAEALDVIESKVNQSFSDDRAIGRILKDIAKKRRVIEKSIKEAKSFIDGLAKKQIPKDFKSIGTYVFKRFLDSIEGRFNSAERTIYINLFDDDDTTRLQFTDVLHLTDFENAENYTYRNWYVVITYVASPNETSDMYLSTEVSFTVPSREPRSANSRGSKFRNKKEALKLLVADLELEGFLDVLNQSPVPFEKKDLPKSVFRSQDYISKIKIEEDSLQFILKKSTKAEQEEVLKEIYLDLKAMVRDSEFKRGIKYNLDRRGSKTIITFRFRHPEPRAMKKVKVNKTRLKEMQKEFDLTNEQTKNLYRLITAPKEEE